MFRARATGPSPDSRSSLAVGPFSRTRAGDPQQSARHLHRLSTNSASSAPTAVNEVIRSPGQPLDPATRAFFETRYGHDFSRVRVHVDREAAASVRAVGAAAYTVGAEIAFAEGRYKPHTAEGRRLLAHELAHVAQHGGAPDTGPNIQIGESSDPAERDAEASAEQALKGRWPPRLYPSAAAPKLRRTTVNSWAGSFDNDLEYNLRSQNDGKGEGTYGARIQIRFTPTVPPVLAEKVGLVQAAVTYWNDQSYSMGKSDAETEAIEKLSTRSGTHIDVHNVSIRTPLAGMRNPPGSSSDLAASVPNRDYSRFGTPSAKNIEDRQAWQFDPAGLATVPDQVAASQSLETAALAVSGPQKGVYYGSVTWGWEKAADAKEATLKPFRLRSKEAPSSEFGEAAKLWNKATTDTGAQMLALPIATGKFIARERTPLMDNADAGKRVAWLDLDTRVEITGKADQKHPDWSSVIVTEGPLVGKQGWVKTSLLADFAGRKRKKP